MTGRDCKCDPCNTASAKDMDLVITITFSYQNSGFRALNMSFVEKFYKD